MTDPTCTATRHGATGHYYKTGCPRPEARAAKAAERRRWPQPSKARGVDPVAIYRACLGDQTIHLGPAERQAAIIHLAAKGRPHQWIADQLGISRRTVVRHTATTRSLDRTAA